MKKKDPFVALESYYEKVDRLDTPGSLELTQRHARRARLAPELLKWASACTAGVVIALAITFSFSTPHAPESIPGSSWGLSEQLAKNGLKLEELLGADPKRSENEEVSICRV
jgi:hypothetical protein